MTTRELLAEWHQAASIKFASRFLPKRLYEQDKLDFIRDTLLSSFPKKYFKIDPRQELDSTKINWIKSLLLAVNRLSAVKALYEIALQLRYCRARLDLWQKFMELQPNPINLRSFFFELFVYKTFDDAGIENRKNPKIGQQELEGYCTLLGQEHLFECKLPYAPKLDELFIIQRLMGDLLRLSAGKSPLNGYIAEIHLARPVTVAHRNELLKKLDRFYKGLPTGVEVPIDYTDGQGLTRFRARTYTKDLLAQIEKENTAAVIQYLVPTGKLGPEGRIQMEGKVAGRFNILLDEMYDKLETILKKEKKQHPPGRFPGKVLFIGSESFPEFQFGLFADISMFDQQRVAQVCNKVKVDCIVCFIRKYYWSDDPSIFIDVLAPERLQSEAQLIKHLFGGLRV